jgi:hypothetical protein
MGKAVSIDGTYPGGSAGNQNGGKFTGHDMLLLMMDIMIIFMIYIMYKSSDFGGDT